MRKFQSFKRSNMIGMCLDKNPQSLCSNTRQSYFFCNKMQIYLSFSFIKFHSCSEAKRMELENQLNGLMKSDQRMYDNMIVFKVG